MSEICKKLLKYNLKQLKTTIFALTIFISLILLKPSQFFNNHDNEGLEC